MVEAILFHRSLQLWLAVLLGLVPIVSRPLLGRLPVIPDANAAGVPARLANCLSVGTRIFLSCMRLLPVQSGLRLSAFDVHDVGSLCLWHDPSFRNLLTYSDSPSSHLCPFRRVLFVIQIFLDWWSSVCNVNVHKLLPLGLLISRLPGDLAT